MRRNRRWLGIMGTMGMLAVLVAAVLLRGAWVAHAGTALGSRGPAIACFKGSVCAHPSWQVVTSLNPATYGDFLYGVATDSSSNAWAVGNYTPTNGIEETLIERWDGTVWSVASSPNPGTLYNGLIGVAALSSSSAWAVGSADNAPLVEQWNGSAWNVVSTPAVSWEPAYFAAVAAVSADDVWAVGSQSDASGNSLTLIEHWNGTSWSIVSSPSPSTTRNQLYSVAAISASDIWAVGYYFAANGPEFGSPLIEHWNGTTWSVVSAPAPGAEANVLNGLAAASSNDVWAVGTQNAISGATQTLAEHWNGTAWSVVPTPDLSMQDNTFLQSVTAISSTDVMAAGYDNQAGRALVEQWNGTSWSIQWLSPISPDLFQLDSIAATTSNSIWAVGLHLVPPSGGGIYSSGYRTVTLIERYHPIFLGVSDDPLAHASPGALPSSPIGN